MLGNTAPDHLELPIPVEHSGDPAEHFSILGGVHFEGASRHKNVRMFAVSSFFLSRQGVGVVERLCLDSIAIAPGRG